MVPATKEVGSFYTQRQCDIPVAFASRLQVRRQGPYFFVPAGVDMQTITTFTIHFGENQDASSTVRADL